MAQMFGRKRLAPCGCCGQITTKSHVKNTEEQQWRIEAFNELRDYEDSLMDCE